MAKGMLNHNCVISYDIYTNLNKQWHCVFFYFLLFKYTYKKNMHTNPGPNLSSPDIFSYGFVLISVNMKV